MIEKIISGGQTGADRAGLDFAIHAGIPHGGWCPRGRIAEDGPIPPCYNMTEMMTTSYPPRTSKNVQESDGTVIFTEGVIDVESGCALTLRLCQKFQKPHMAVDLARARLEDVAHMLRVFVKDKQIKTLNVAGSRKSKAPDIYLKVMRVLELAFTA